MKKFLLLIVISLISSAALPQDKKLTSIDYDDKMEWWREAKFGMFIHWGPYALYGGVYNGFNQQKGGAEWIMNRCKIPVREYKAKASTFNPAKYNADAIVKLAKLSGMKYIVITTKHHDGFAMFQSDASKFNIVDYTPFKRDAIDEMVNACRKHQIKFGFYYSQSQDWTNEGGATSRKLMRDGWPNPDSTEIDAYVQANKGAWDYLQTTASFDSYIHRIALPQLKELLSRYPDVDIIWWDTPMSINDEQASLLLKEVEKYPHIITNDRLKRPNFGGDYRTPEELVPQNEDVNGVDWETCMNIGSSWGYKSWENKWKSAENLIRILTTIASKGGNYLLNIGPGPDGTVPVEAVSRLDSIGKWMSVNGEAIYGTTRSSIHPDWGSCIRKDTGTNSCLYLCVYTWPKDGKLTLDCTFQVKKASYLRSGQILKTITKQGKTIVNLPLHVQGDLIPVIKLELKEKLPEIKIKSNTERFFEITDTRTN